MIRQFILDRFSTFAFFDIETSQTKQILSEGTSAKAIELVSHPIKSYMEREGAKTIYHPPE